MPNIELKGTPLDTKWIWAVMLFPDNDLIREQLFAIEEIEHVVKDANDDDRIEINAHTLKFLVDSPAYDALRDEVRIRTKEGVVAGDLLAIMYLMDRFQLPEPSMNKAIFAASEFAKRNKYGDGSSINSSERMIRKYWNKYASVAHLWGAFRMNQVYSFAPTDKAVDYENSTPFLAAAKGLYNFGVNFIPFRAKNGKPILDAGMCWAVPENIAASNLDPQRKPTTLINTLKKYKA
jgi:hypothetical protein